MNLKQQTVSGFKWNGLSVAIKITLKFITFAIFARLLSPLEFGMMAMIAIVNNFALLLADFGLSNAIIQKKEVPDTHLSTLFWLNVLMGIILFIFILLISPLITLYFKQPELFRYLKWAACVFLLSPLSQIFTVILKKELNFKILARVEVATLIVYSISAVSLAYRQYGLYSLLFGRLISVAFNALIVFFIFRNTWWPKFHFNLKEIYGYFKFGSFQMGERLLNYLSTNIDYILIGRLLGTEALGFYTLAYNLVTMPVNMINPIITQVSFPVFSKIQDDNTRIKKGYCKMLEYISLVTFPLLLGLLIVAPEFVEMVYSAKWIPAVGVLQILCLIGISRSIGNPSGSVLLAKGRADIGFYWNVFAVLATSLAIVIGVNWGIIGVGIALLSLQPPFSLIMQPIVNRLMELTWKRYFKSMSSSFVCALLMLLAVTVFKFIFKNLSMGYLLTSSILCGLFTYIFSYYFVDKNIFIEIRSLIKGN